MSNIISQHMPGDKKIHTYWVIALLSLISSLLVMISVNIDQYEIEIELSVAKKGDLQVFFSPTNSFFLGDNVFKTVDTVNVTTKYTINVEGKYISYLRIDPPGSFELKSLKIRNCNNELGYSGSTLMNIIKSKNDIAKITVSNAIIKGDVSGDDPYIVLNGFPVLNTLNSLKYYLVLIVSIIFFAALYFIVWSKFLKYDWYSDHKYQQWRISDSIYKIFVGGSFVWFIYQIMFYALNIGENISPDEVFHIRSIQFYSSVPIAQLRSAQIPDGLEFLIVSPYFYHIFMGYVLKLNLFGVQDIIFLRFINAIISTVSLYFTFKLVKEVTNERIIHVAILVIQTNILMFVFISGMVSYDNFINLLSTASFYLLIKFLKTFSRKFFFWLILTMIVGALTKITYGPIIVIQLLIIVFFSKDIWNNRQSLLTLKFKKVESVLLFLIISLFTLNVMHHGGNLVKYNSVNPSYHKYIAADEIEKNGLYKRQVLLNSTVNERPMMPVYKYLIKYVHRIGETTVGVCGHKNLVPSIINIGIFYLVLAISLMLYILNYRRIPNVTYLNMFLFAIGIYLVIVMYSNYASYSKHHMFGLALQGRYNFPVLSLLNIFVAYNLFHFLRSRSKFILLIIITVYLILSNYVWFVNNVSPSWYLS